jgi:hypothetical protein
LTTDAQVVDDHVVVERSFMLIDGYAVVHIDQGGRMGRAIGHVPLSAGPDENYEIPLDQEFLSQIDGAATVWVTLHRSDGDGEFEPNQDTALTGLQGRAAGVTIPVFVSSDGNVNVVARDFSSQRIDSASVTLRRIETNQSGFAVVEDRNGTIVGAAAVVNENVSVPVSSSFYESLSVNETAPLTATVYHDDGSGSFDADADTRVAVAGSPVSSEFSVKKVANASRTTSIVVTASGTTTPRTATSGAGDASDSTTDDGSTASASSSSSSSSGPSPGFGVVAVALAVLALVAASRRR